MEEWKTVIVNGEVYNNYMVSNLGNVKSLNYNHTGKEKILKPAKDRDNYLIVNLSKNGKRKKYLIHRLAAEVFIPKIEGKEFVDHINGIRDDNRIDNLRWCTNKENSNFDLARKHRSEERKGKYIGEKCYWYGKHHTEETKRKIAKANGKQVLCIELNKIYGSTCEAERETGIKQANISKCCNRERKSSGKHPVTGEKLHWKYIELLPCYNEEVNDYEIQ